MSSDLTSELLNLVRMLNPKRMSNFSTICPKTAAIKNEQYEIFNSVCSYGKLRDSSLSVFVVLYLKLVENIEQNAWKQICPLLANWNEADDITI